MNRRSESINNYNNYNNYNNDNYNNYDNIPNLIESNVKYFINNALQNSNTIKNKYYNNIFNIICFFIFIVLLTLILFFMYKGNKNTKDINIKRRKDKEQIINKLLRFKQQSIKQQNIANNLITDLPMY